MKRQGQALLSSLWIFRAIVFVFCLSLFSVPTAFSQDKSLSFDGKKKRKRSGKVQRLKYKFKKKKKVIFKFKKRKKTKRELAEEAARKKKSTKKALGSSVGQSLQKAMDQEQAKLRMQKIKLYKRVIPTLPDDEPTSRRRKATMYYQLAEEYWEQSKFLRFLSLEKHNKAMEQWDKKCRKIGDPSKCPKAPKPDLLKSNAYRSQAITIYRKLLKKFPKYSRADEVMFYLGLNLMETKRHKEGLSRFKTLIKQFSKRGSRFIPDAYTALGEYYFNKNKVQDAMYNYGYSLKTARGFYRKKTTPDDLRVSMRGVHLRAMYMLAWCDFNVGNYEKALKRFKRVVQLSIRYKKTKESRVLLKNDSLRDLILVFSKMDATKVAYDYFKGVMGAQYAYRAGKKLARKYYGQSNYVRSIKMYRFMMGINEKGFKSTLGPDTPVFQNEIVRSAARIWKPKKIYTEVLKLMSYFEPDNPWFKKWEPVKKVYKVAEESAEQTLLEYSTKYHQLAQKEKQNKRKKEQYYDFAIKLYDQYLRYFPRTESAYELRFYLGELLYRKAKLTSPNVKRLSKKARDYYKRASRHYYLTTLKKGQFKKQASFSEILCYEALAGRTGSAELKGAGKKLRGLRKTKDGKVTWDKKKIKKGSWDARLLKAYQRYLTVVKDKDERLQAFFKTGTIYYSYKHYLKSMDIFSKMAKEFPNHELSRRAAFMILYSYEDLGQWAKLQDSARLFIKDPKLTAKSKFKKEMYYMIIRSGYLYIMEDLKAAKTNDAKLAIAE
ncbi:MAG TPA: hypothetical protein DCE42_15890, partial [Myxococcales bacterium]|nr:hypothetical protein [Myxococcales bacterium]